MKILVGLLCFCLLLSHTTIAWAYDERSHGQTVRDAFRYIIEIGDQPQFRYPDGHSNKTDLESLQEMFLGRVPRRPDSSALLPARDTLAKASQATDYDTDLVLQGRSYMRFFEGHRLGPISFTTFGHFVNVATAGTFWAPDGYHFPWIGKNPRCSVPTPNIDHHVNSLINLAPARVETVKSRAFRAYKLSSRADVKDHFEKLDLNEVVFWPISLIAEHHFAAFLQSPARGHVPTTPWHLGPALHAVEDATVPYHAIGVSGCGHVKYETLIEDTYGNGVDWYDPTKVKTLLLTKPFLRMDRSISELITELAKEASNHCGLKPDGWECKIWDDQSIARETINLAVAANIVVLRKAAFEWNRTRPSGSRSLIPPVIGSFAEWVFSPAKAHAQNEADRRATTLLRSGRPASGNPSFLEESGLAGRGLTSIFEVEPEIGELTGPREALGPARDLLQGSLLQVRDRIGELSLRKTSAGRALDLCDSEVNRVGDFFARNRAVTWNPGRLGFVKEVIPGFPPLMSAGPRFRNPTEGELRQPESLFRYRRQRESFDQALTILDTFRLRAALEGSLRKLPPGDELAEAQRAGARLRQYHFDLLRQAESTTP